MIYAIITAVCAIISGLCVVKVRRRHEDMKAHMAQMLRVAATFRGGLEGFGCSPAGPPVSGPSSYAVGLSHECGWGYRVEDHELGLDNIVRLAQEHAQAGCH